MYLCLKTAAGGLLRQECGELLGELGVGGALGVGVNDAALAVDEHYAWHASDVELLEQRRGEASGEIDAKHGRVGRLLGHHTLPLLIELVARIEGY